MSTLFHSSKVTGNPDAHYSALQRETFELISQYCHQFRLDEDIEFTCFELIHKHFKNVQRKILSEMQYSARSSDVENNLNVYLQQAIFTIKTDLPLNLFSIISITAKYFGSHNWIEMFKMLPKILHATGRTVSFRELYQTEFNIFRDLDFCIKRSAPYHILQTILEYCSIKISPTIYQLHATCITFLRFTYTQRQNIYKKAYALSRPAEDYIVNATFIASVVVFASATYDKSNDLYANDLLELIKVRTGFSDNNLQNFSHAILSEFRKI